MFNSQNSLTYLIFSGSEKLEELCVEEKIRGKNRKLGHSYLFVIPIAQKRTKKGPQKQLDRFFKNTRKENGKKIWILKIVKNCSNVTVHRQVFSDWKRYPISAIRYSPFKFRTTLLRWLLLGTSYHIQIYVQGENPYLRKFSTGKKKNRSSHDKYWVRFRLLSQTDWLDLLRSDGERNSTSIGRDLYSSTTVPNIPIHVLCIVVICSRDRLHLSTDTWGISNV